MNARGARRSFWTRSTATTRTMFCIRPSPLPMCRSTCRQMRSKSIVSRSFIPSCQEASKGWSPTAREQTSQSGATQISLSVTTTTPSSSSLLSQSSSWQRRSHLQASWSISTLRKSRLCRMRWSRVVSLEEASSSASLLDHHLTSRSISMRKMLYRFGTRRLTGSALDHSRIEDQ